MARPTTPTLTDAELRLMKVLWRRGPSTAAAVVAELVTTDVRLAESTVRTILDILENKGYVALERRGRANHYRALVTRSGAQREALQHLLSSFFDNSREELVLQLIRDETASPREIDRLRRIIQDA